MLGRVRDPRDPLAAQRECLRVPAPGERGLLGDLPIGVRGSSTCSATDIQGRAALGRGADRLGAEPRLGDSARGLFALVDLAQRSVSEGWCIRSSTAAAAAGTRSGARRSTTTSSSLDEIAAALPLVSAERFHGDRDATVGDLYPPLVDQIARDRLSRGRRQARRPSPRPPDGDRVVPDGPLRRTRSCRRARATSHSSAGSRAGSTTAWRGRRTRRGASRCISTSAPRTGSRSSCGCTRTTTRR